MKPVLRPGDFHPQDWIIVVEALAQWAEDESCRWVLRLEITAQRRSRTPGAPRWAKDTNSRM